MMLASASPRGWVADSRCVVIGQGSNLFLSPCVCVRARLIHVANNLCIIICAMLAVVTELKADINSGYLWMLATTCSNSFRSVDLIWRS
jgi:hypothetical protein